MGAKSTKKQRKHDRNRLACLAYKNSNRREHNKVNKLQRHLKRFPSDPQALAAVERRTKLIRGF